MFGILVVLVVIGVLLWLINTLIPMDAKVKKIMNIAVIVCVILRLLNVIGVFGYLKSVPAPHVQVTPIEMVA